MKKLISVAVIFLFIGLAFAPSINANVSKEELIEFTTEICGLNSGKQTVKLTQKQADEVEALFNSIRQQLNATKSRNEAEEIFKDAIVELDKYGLLGGLSVKQAKRLVTGQYQYYIVNRILNILSDRYLLKLDTDENLFCLITGVTELTIFEGYLSRIYGYIHPLKISASIIGTLLDVKNSIAIGDRIGFGLTDVLWNLTENANGWVHTNGLNGVKYWNGSIRGNLSFSYRMFWQKAKPGEYLPINGMYGVHQGVRGFRGIKITMNTISYQQHYIGFATRVKISPDPF